MAIEKNIIPPSTEDLTKSRNPEEVQVEEIMNIVSSEDNVTMLDDGSAILGDSEDEMIQSDFDSNLAELIEESELAKISNKLIGGIEKDTSSREDWEKTYTDGLKYLGMKFDAERSQPFQGASGVTHPLLGEAVTTFQAQAYKELLPSNGPVKTQVVGFYDSIKEHQAQRVQDFMNYQIVHVMEEFDEELDQMLFYLPLAGSAFKKVYYDENLGRAVSKFVPPEDLIVPYYTTDLESCSRITNVIKMSENDVKKLQASGFYRMIDLDVGQDVVENSQIKEEINKLSGIKTGYDSDDLAVLYEVHCNLDLDGFEDVDREGNITGIKLPYIVTIDANNQEILSIRRNFKEGDPLKNKVEYFVHFKFLPGLGFYGFGLTHMMRTPLFSLESLEM